MKFTIDIIPSGRTTATILLTQEQVAAIFREPGRGRVPLAITYRKQTVRTRRCSRSSASRVGRGRWPEPS
ncbi:MAG: hypothetical protein F2842_11430 [Actinobacteria bacterium]|uniref:Unannotated protein n=1 Tax=freshwater metagenome TaxID=449393 RepID=A0A6J7LDG6_9ZZZZ|nr:hypothetical protein [Actinomycetota bacterium]